MRIVACPGQGSQSEGFLKPWIEQIPGFEETLKTLGEAASRDLVWLGTEAPEEIIKDTSNAQPLIVGASIAAYRTALVGHGFEVAVGHSVGEFAAAAIASILTDEDAMRLVSVRADAMAEAAALQETSMAAVLGGESSQVLQELEARGLQAANFNGAGQIVAAGLKALISELVSNPIQGTRCIELKVAGAFHTIFMHSAVAKLKTASQNVAISDPGMAIYTNKTGKCVSSGQEFVELMISQVANPVRWDLCMENLNIAGAELIELPPAGALAGLAKRGMPNASALAIKTPQDLEKLGN
ncbi:MAG: hypothetical protein RIS08_994 [Actinomycetota bacterium]|jgi:[acyl-carrier-protein] S-malonyltransferase